MKPGILFSRHKVKAAGCTSDALQISQVLHSFIALLEHLELEPWKLLRATLLTCCRPVLEGALARSRLDFENHRMLGLLQWLKTMVRQTLRAQDYAVLQLPVAAAPRIDRTPGTWVFFTSPTLKRRTLQLRSVHEALQARESQEPSGFPSYFCWIFGGPSTLSM